MNKCFLCAVFKSPVRTLHQVVKFNSDNFMEFVIEYVDSSELASLAIGTEYKTDFQVKDNILLWSGETIEIEDYRLEACIGKSTEFKAGNSNVYSILLKLIEMDGIYVSKSQADVLEDGSEFPAVEVTRLSSLRVSSSTMSVSASIRDEESWKTRIIIGNSDHGMYLNPFCVLVEKFKYVNIPEVTVKKEITLAGEVYCMIEIDESVSIYPQYTPTFSLQPALINARMVDSVADKAAISLLSNFIKILEVSIYGEKEEPEAVHKYDKAAITTGVFFELLWKGLQGYDYSLILQRIMSEYLPAVNSGTSILDISKQLKAAGKTFIEVNATLNTLYILHRTTGKSKLEILETCLASRRELQKSSLKGDLELFGTRAYMYLTDCILPGYEDTCVAQGGNFYYKTLIRKEMR